MGKSHIDSMGWTEDWQGIGRAYRFWKYHTKMVYMKAKMMGGKGRML